MFALTLDSTEFSREEAMKYFYEIGIKELPKPDRGKKYSGKLIFSQLLPKDLNLEYKTFTCSILKKIGMCEGCTKDKCGFDAYLKITNGKLVSGVIDKESLGEGIGKLVDALARHYPSEVIEEFYAKASRIVSELLTAKGMTVGLDEYLVSDHIEKEKQKAIKETIEKAEELVSKYKKGNLEHIAGKSIEESFETFMMQNASEGKSAVEKQVFHS